MVASPEYTENTIALFREAADANLATPGRVGNVIDIGPQSGDDVMLTGDLHGHRRNFNLIRRIAALETLPRRHLVMQEACHGGPTYPQNGGCMSHAMVEDIARLKVRYPDRVHFLLGNHELAELTDYPIQKNKQMLNVLFRMGLEQMYGAETERVREALLGFLRTCPLAVRIAGGVFVCHSIPEGLDERPFDQTIFTPAVGSAGILRAGGHFPHGLGARSSAGERPGLRGIDGSPGLDSRSRALPGRFCRAQSAPGDFGLLRRPGLLRRAFHRPGVDAGRSRRADPAAGVRVPPPLEHCQRVGPGVEPMPPRSARPLQELVRDGLVAGDLRADCALAGLPAASRPTAAASLASIGWSTPQHHSP